jgi:hypothetical protein
MKLFKTKEEKEYDLYKKAVGYTKTVKPLFGKPKKKYVMPSAKAIHKFLKKYESKDIRV